MVISMSIAFVSADGVFYANQSISGESGKLEKNKMIMKLKFSVGSVVLTIKEPIGIRGKFFSLGILFDVTCL